MSLDAIERPPTVLDPASEVPEVPGQEELPFYPPKVGPTRVSEWERADNYWGAIFCIPDTNWRVAVCRDGYQWILQQREAKDHWENKKFFARKQHLAEAVEAVIGEEAYQRVADRIEGLPI